MHYLFKFPLVPLALFCALVVSACGPEITFDDEARPLLESYDDGTTPQTSADVGNSDTGDPDTGDSDTSQAQTLLTDLDHTAWDGVVRHHVKGRCFAYNALDANAETLSLIRVYIQQLGRLDLAKFPDDRAKRLALWINVYNAVTVFGVLQERRDNPEFTVLDGVFEFFNLRQFQVGDMVLSPNMIEHGILRGRPDHNSLADLDEDILARLAEESEKLGPIDPRFHMAINCASLSCPNLRAEAYTGEKLDAQLNAQTTEFLDDPFKGAGPEGISSIFLWFTEDFQENGGSVESFIETYRTEGLRDVRTGAYLNYDWDPNAFSTHQEFCTETP